MASKSSCCCGSVIDVDVKLSYAYGRPPIDCFKRKWWSFKKWRTLFRGTCSTEVVARATTYYSVSRKMCIIFFVAELINFLSRPTTTVLFSQRGYRLLVNRLWLRPLS